MRRSFALLFVTLAILPGGPPTTAGAWAWPVSAPHPILRPFIAPETRYAAGHRGIDVATDDPRVFAPAAGVVHFSGVVVDRPVLSIRHPGGLLSSFEPVDSPLPAGTAVRRGEVVGTLQPGHCSRLCLHFGVRRDGEYVSPLLFLGGIPRSVLLPTRPLAAGSAGRLARFWGAAPGARVEPGMAAQSRRAHRSRQNAARAPSREHIAATRRRSTPAGRAGGAVGDLRVPHLPRAWIHAELANEHRRAWIRCRWHGRARQARGCASA